MDDCFRDKKDSIVLCNMKYDEVRSRFPKMIEGLDEGITRVTKLVEDLKAYARQEPAIFFEPVDLPSVISKALRLTNSIIKKSTKHFSVDISTPFQLLMAICTRLNR
jgi:polar amino acid transport system substrate-binding protein